jgi:type IV pilus assembly protein PilB
MSISDGTLQEILVKSGKVPQDVLDELVVVGKTEKKALSELVIKRQLATEKEITRLYGEYIDVPFVELTNLKIDKELQTLIPARIAQKYKAVVFGKTEDGRLKLAMDDPDDVQAIDFLQKQLGKNLDIYIAPQSEIELALNDYRGSISSEISKVGAEGEEGEEGTEEEEVSEEDLAEDSPIAQTVNLILEYAIKQRASDVHIEPREGHVQVRYRIDGVLREVNKLPRKVLSALVSRIKILATLKIDEHRAPQDGRFKISHGGDLFAIRVSTLPVMDGEKVVMRLLNESTTALGLEDLGFWGDQLTRIQHAITQPHGIILVTGPTGSGKSTTLYSILTLLNKPDVNISTVEDPVEYRIEGANQTQVNPKAKMTFAAGLRSLLRQDPNIIMVGEIRDSETANLAIQAALTGHLVFSTLHTNNAATSLPRLLDMGIEPFLIASTVRAVVGQRLVRKLSPKCRETFEPSGDQLAEIEHTFQIDQGMEQAAGADSLQALIEPEKESLAPKNKGRVVQPLHAAGEQKSLAEKLAADPGMLERSAADAAKMASTEAVLETKSKETTKKESEPSAGKLTLWRAVEAGECAGNAYKSRIGIYEVLTMSEALQKLITAHATSEEIQQQAISEGMITMQQDGFIKCIQGLTSLEEILRVTRE